MRGEGQQGNSWCETGESSGQVKTKRDALNVLEGAEVVNIGE